MYDRRSRAACRITPRVSRCLQPRVRAPFLTSRYRSIHGLNTAHASRPPVAMMKMKTTASSFCESRSMSQEFMCQFKCFFPRSHRTSLALPRQRDELRGSLTEASGEDILLLSPFTCRQLVVETELAIAVVATQRAVFLCALGEEILLNHVFSFINPVPRALIEP